MITSLKRWILNRLWEWRTRCRTVRSSADMPTALLAQIFLHIQQKDYIACRRCGSHCCANAVKRDVPIYVPISDYLRRHGIPEDVPPQQRP